MDTISLLEIVKKVENEIKILSQVLYLLILKMI